MTDFNIDNREQAKLNYNLKHPGTLLQKIITFLLSAQGLYGLYQSVKLIVFERGQIENAISSHQVGEGTIDQFMSQAALTVFSTALSFFFAIRLSSRQGKLSKNLQTVIAILLIIANTYIMNFLNQLPILERVLSLLNL
jgi:hypothetical protein